MDKLAIIEIFFYEVIAMKCPNCSSKDIGKIGVNQYYCWNCFVELSIQKGIMHVHQVEEDGVLSSLDDLFSLGFVYKYRLKREEETKKSGG
jgi:DNA-directed RNA polymerase subunit RPC12/RpoP